MTMKTVVQVSNESTDSVSSSAGNVTTKFQKLMLLGGGTGQVVVNVGGDGGGVGPTADNAISVPNARKPTVQHQGRMVRIQLPNMSSRDFLQNGLSRFLTLHSRLLVFFFYFMF